MHGKTYPSACSGYIQKCRPPASKILSLENTTNSIYRGNYPTALSGTPCTRTKQKGRATDTLYALSRVYKKGGAIVYHFLFNSLNPSSSFLHVLLLSGDDDDIAVVLLSRELNLGVRFLTDFAQSGPTFPDHIGMKLLEHTDLFMIVGCSLRLVSKRELIRMILIKLELGKVYTKSYSNLICNW